MPESIYLDAIATTPVSDSVRQRMLPYLGETYGLPSGAHTLALNARDALEESRNACREFMDTSDRTACVFAGSGTEANNLALLGYIRRNGTGSRVVTSVIEHPSILGACDSLEGNGCEVVRLRVDPDGRLSPDEVADCIDQGDLFVTHLANYDIGTKQDLTELGQICRRAGAVFMVDATYGAGWNEFSMNELGVDLATFSPHRFFGPAGVGALMVGQGMELQPLYFGGNQEFGLRPGSGSMASMIGAGAACTEAGKHHKDWIQAVTVLQCDFMQLLSEELTEFQLNGTALGIERDPHHLSLSIRGVEGEAVLLNLDLKGVQLTSNTGCVTASEKVSPVLGMVGVEQEMAMGTLVAGLLPYHTKEEIRRSVDLLVAATERVRSMSQAWHQFLAGNPSES